MENDLDAEALLFVYPDVISIEKTGEHFRLIYDVKGRFTVHRITAEEAKVRNKPVFSLYPSSSFLRFVNALTAKYHY